MHDLAPCHNTQGTRNFIECNGIPVLKWQGNSPVCCTFLCVPSSFAIILMGKRELVALLSLSSWCLLIVVWLFLALQWVSLQFVIGIF